MRVLTRKHDDSMDTANDDKVILLDTPDGQRIGLFTSRKAPVANPGVDVQNREKEPHNCSNPNA